MMQIPHHTTKKQCRHGFTLVELMIAALMGSALVPILIRFSQASTASDAMVRARVSARIEQMHTIDFIAQDIQRASGYETSVQIGRPPTAQPVMPVAAGCVPPVGSAALFVLLSSSGNQNDNVVYYGYAGLYAGPGETPGSGGWADSARLFRCGRVIECTGTPQTCTPGTAIVTSFVAHAAEITRPVRDCIPTMSIADCLDELKAQGIPGDLYANEFNNVALMNRIFPLKVKTFACYGNSGRVDLDRTTKQPTPASQCLPSNADTIGNPNPRLVTMDASSPTGGTVNGVF